MAKVTIRDNSIWLRHIEGDNRLVRRLDGLGQDDVIELEVNGIVGRWQRMRPGKDGRDTPGIKPIDAMREVWARMQSQRGKIVDIREARTADSYLAALTPLMSEWDSPEDEEAVVVPFPFVEMPVVKRRPAVVLSKADFNGDNGQSILAMVTTAAGSSWPSDIGIEDGGTAGLLRASVVRWKVFTMPNNLIDRKLGTLGTADATNVRHAMQRILPVAG
jgi:mRNA-degrading endonuclease toxin of MazEF toxin-antitoxin module